MVLFQCVQPPGQIHPKLRHGEGIQQRPEHPADSLGIQGLAVCHQRLQGKLFPQVLGRALGRLAPGIPGVHHHQEGFAGFAHIRHRPALRFQIILPGNIRNCAISGHHQADGAVLLHHFFRPQLCRLGHGDFRIEPGGCHHSRLAVLLRPYRPRNHVAHGVDEPHPQPGGTVGRNFHRFLRNKFRLRGHNGPPGAALGQLIPGTLLAVGVGDSGDHQFFHNPLDQGGFSRTDRANYPHVNIAAGPGGDVRINLIHSQSPSWQEEGSCPGFTKGYVPERPNRTVHNMLCFFFAETKDFVKIMFDKSRFSLYNI